jgi:catechol 2,3-dioxygenase-like lactoylglutathione lyase family enzyme
MGAIADKSAAAHNIHHVNFPMIDRRSTAEWYAKVFGMKEFVRAPRPDGAPTPDQDLLMTHENFQLHFTPVDQVDPKDHYHFAIEVEDFDGFLAHLDAIGVPYGDVGERAQFNSKWAVLRDPDGHHVQITWHGNRAS